MSTLNILLFFITLCHIPLTGVNSQIPGYEVPSLRFDNMNFNTDGFDRRESPIPVPEDPTNTGSSLTFVFDSTGSMFDDLVQVIVGAVNILETAMSRREKPLYNFGLVPFHDPGKHDLTDFLSQRK